MKSSSNGAMVAALEVTFCFPIQTEASQIFLLELFPKIVKGFYSLVVFAKISFLDVWHTCAMFVRLEAMSKAYSCKIWYHEDATQLTITCSNSAIETLEKSVKYVQS